MKINRIYIKNFGGISDKEYILSDGLNVIFGHNESGKSTFLSFIRFMFYGAKKQRGKELSFRDKYMPWSGEDMSGEIEFTADGTDYSLSRSISATGRKKDVRLINKTTGDTIAVTDGDELGTELFKMSEQSFLKTLFIGAEGSLISSDGELVSKISNVSQSGDESVSYQAICDEINNMIADLSSPRRSKAVIPQIEKKLEILKSKKEDAENRFANKSELAAKLELIDTNLDNALKRKIALSDQLKRTRQYRDYQAYKKAADKLNEAEKAYNDIIASGNDIAVNKDAITLTDEEEKIILHDNSAEIAEAKTKELLARDKASSAKTSAVISIIVAVVFAIAGIFFPIAFIGTVLFATIAVYLFSASRKHNSNSEDAMKDIVDAESKKADILKKYGFDSAEHYKAVKIQKADETAREDIRREKIEMAKNLFDERKGEYETLCKTLKEKYDRLESLECDPADYTEDVIASQLINAEDDIVKFTAMGAEIRKDAESVNGISQEITNIEREIKDLTETYNEANDKLHILNLAIEILQESYEEMKSNFAPKLAKETAEVFNAMTSGKYGELIVNDAFEIQIKNNGKYENSNFFSLGTIQQLYFSLRLGIIELIMGNYPLFIDDAFITYDDERFRNASDFLKDYSSNNQIIFTTCHTRERNIDGAKILNF